MTLEEVLEKIKTFYKKKSNVKLMFIALAVVVILACAVDIFLPKHSSVFNIIRTVMAFIGAFPMFLTAYYVALKQHDVYVAKAEENDELYNDYRLRYTASTRLKQAIIFCSVLAAIAMMTSFSPIYTIAASVVLAGIFASVVYCRMTPKEQYYRDNDLPDPRDVALDELEKDRKLTRDAMIELRKDEIRRKKEKGADSTAEEDFLGYSPMDSDGQDVYSSDDEDEDVDDYEDEDLDDLDVDEADDEPVKPRKFTAADRRRSLRRRNGL